MTTQQRNPQQNRNTGPGEAGWRCGDQAHAPVTHRPSLSWRLRH